MQQKLLLQWQNISRRRARGVERRPRGRRLENKSEWAKARARARVFICMR